MKKLIYFFILMFFLIQVFNYTVLAAGGTIKGKVTELSNNNVLPGANILLEGTNIGAATDVNGNFIISGIVPGEYKVKVSFLGYDSQTVDVVVKENITTTLEIALKENSLRIDQITVYGDLSRGQAKSLNEQKNAPNIKNVVSSEQFLLFPDRNAAEVLGRIPGISISYDQGEGEMVQIRGIGPQFNSITLNGQRIPAPDPGEGRAVGLDLLNQDLLENIVVTKALTPDIDGDAIGGNINFQMKQAPDAGIFALKLGGGKNFQHSDFNNYGSDIINVSSYAGTRFFDNKLGILLAGSYYKTNRGSTLREFEYDDLAAGHIFAQHSNDYDVKRTRWGVNLNTEYKFNDFNRIFLNANYNQFLDDEIRRLVNFAIDDNEEKKETRNRTEDQTLSTVMFGGNHNFSGLKLDYQASWIEAQEDMPDRTYFRYERDNDLTLFTNDEIKNFGPTTVFTGLDPLELNRIRVDESLKKDRDIAGLLNIEIPYTFLNRISTLKFGGKYLNKNASFNRRRLELKKFADTHTIGEAEFGFEDVRVGINDTTYLGATKVKNLDKTSDNYEATEGILAAYGMTNISFSEKIGILAGLRFENTRNEYKTLAIESVNREESDASYSNFLPSAHLTYRFDEYRNLRFAYSTGLSRPPYKKLVPVVFRDDDEREIIRGNPDLKPTNSNNLDLMFENYSSYLGLFTVGIYYKRMSNIIVNSAVRETLPFEGGTQVYEITMPINGDDDANVYGIELALNQRLNFLNIPFFNNFSIYFNYTYTKAEMKIDGRTIPLGYSPDNILNFTLMYDNPGIGLSFVIANQFRDDILTSVGADKFTDQYVKSEFHLDVSIQQRIINNLTLSLQLNNLTDQFENEIFGDPSEDYSRIQQWAKFGPYGTLSLLYRL